MPINLTLPSSGGAIVLGGSGGSGSVICETLARAGSPVAFTYFRGKSCAEATRQKLLDLGVLTIMAAVDGNDHQAVQAFADEAAAQFDGLHIVVYAGGPVVEFGPVADAVPEQWSRFIGSDLNSMFHLIRATVTHLRKANASSIVACVTYANRRVLDRDGLSAQPKAAIESLIRQVAAEEGNHGIRANCVGLGAIDAGMDATDLSVESNTLVEAFGEDEVKKLLANVRLGGRRGTAQEVANAVMFFASEQSSYCTGQAIMVDGGASL